MTSTGDQGHGHRLAALDGLRGVAVGLVLIGHYLLAAPLPVSRDAARAFGDLGVTMFFVLSGWLITSILVREQTRTGRISIRDFYRRRTLRIFPALYTLLLVLLVLAVTGVITLPLEQLLVGGSFTMNYAPVDGSPWIIHLWSLSVEEQFYLFWPLLLILLKPRRAFRFAVAGLVLVPVIRVGWLAAGLDGARVTVYMHTRADSLLVGAALALLPVVAPALYQRVRAVLERPSVAVGAVAALTFSLLASAALGVGLWLVPLGWSINGVATAVLIGHLAVGSESGVRAVFERRSLVGLGLISYSVYLWQQVFLNEDTARVFVTWPVGILAAIVLGWVSYRFVETPFLRLKDRRRQAMATHAPATREYSVLPAAPSVRE